MQACPNCARKQICLSITISPACTDLEAVKRRWVERPAVRQLQCYPQLQAGVCEQTPATWGQDTLLHSRYSSRSHVKTAFAIIPARPHRKTRQYKALELNVTQRRAGRAGVCAHTFGCTTAVCHPQMLSRARKFTAMIAYEPTAPTPPKRPRPRYSSQSYFHVRATFLQ